MTSARRVNRATKLAYAMLGAYLAIGVASGLGLLATSWRTGIEQAESLPPSMAHWLGTDHLGRDILALTLRSCWTAVVLGGSVIALTCCLGTLLGIGSAWSRRRIDPLTTALATAISAIPGLLLVLVVATAVGPGLLSLTLALSLVGWIGVYRLVRAESVRLRDSESLLAAEAQGASLLWLWGRQLLPQLLPILRIQAALILVGAIQAEAVLAFLGLGSPEHASWGRMIAEAWAFDDLGHGRWWRLTAATCALAGMAWAALEISRSDESRRP